MNALRTPHPGQVEAPARKPGAGPFHLFRLWLGSLLVASTAFAATNAVAQRIFRIMPVGDSITQGGATFSCYRLPLWEMLSTAGYPIEFVGSRTNQSRIGPLPHEGYGGKNAEFLAANVGLHFREHPADIVLLHAGHNHFAEEHPVPKILTATESMIATFRAVNPQVTVLLAQVIPSGKLPKYAYIPALNEALAKLARRLDTPRQRVIAVNMAEGFDWKTDTIADHVHPNARGAEKMAAHWFAALTNVLESPKPPSIPLQK